MRKITFILPAFLFIPVVLSAASAAEIPWPEHPRPDWERPAWVNLNGQWDFAFDPEDAGLKAEWFKPGKHRLERKITVPFPWESRLSGIADTEYKGVAWYSREITLPDGEEWKDKNAWLVIGACDFEAKVWVNGQPAGEHVGGYLPFDVNLSSFAKPGERVTVVIRVVDKTDPQQPTGKQVHWYTRISGIWQTVYLEPRPARYLLRARFLPRLKSGEIICQAAPDDPAPGCYVRLVSPKAEFETASDVLGEHQLFVMVKAKVKDLKPWSPDSPYLYDAELQLVDERGQVLDRVKTYFGMREISIAKAPGRDYQYIHLNGKPIYLAGALHQSFHPEGIYHYPDDATMRSDYELCKRIGINMLRIHIKVPVPRELYWADKLGVLIMQDMPNFWKYSEQSREWYEQMMPAAVARDFNHPSIFAWVDFNETWGIDDGGYDADNQKWVVDMYRATKQIDPTRPVEDNSPCKYDHTETDINSWHFYINDYAAAKRHIAEVVEKTFPGSSFNFAAGFKQGNQPLMNSEYGGIGAGQGDQDISWCFKYLTNELRLHDKICGYIYTELSDIEWEHNGFVNYDRSAKEYGYDFWHPGFSLRDLNGPDFVVIDAPPMLELKPGESRQVPIRISHWSDHQAADLKLRWCLRWLKDGRGEPEVAWQTRPAAWKPFQVVDQEPLTIECGNPLAAVGALLVELLDEDKVLARNYVNVTVDRKLPGAVARGNQLMLTFSPGEYSERTFANPMPRTGGKETAWAAGEGAGYYQYELQLPKGVSIGQIESLALKAELASRSTGQKLDWPARRTPHDRPQTDGKKWPSDLRLSVNGVPLQRLSLKTLPDDSADARGALSHHRGLQGGYGYIVMAEARGDELRAILKEVGRERLLRLRFEVPADARNKGGLTIYGAGVGCHGVPPMVFLSFKGDTGLEPRFKQEASPAVNRASESLQAVLPTAEAGGYEWRFTTKPPPADWAAPEFDTSTWRTGRGAFGSRGTPNAIIGTRWNTNEIWLRTTVEIDDPKSIASAAWRIHHDEDVEIFINGKRVLQRGGFLASYADIPLDAAAIAALRQGRNLIAVHCRQTEGGQNIDVGLTLVRHKQRK